MHNFLFAFKYLFKPRGGNLARLLSLTLALTVSIVIFSYTNYVLTFDRFYPDVERIYQIWDFDDESNISSSMIAPLGPALQEGIPDIEAATRLWGNAETDLCKVNGASATVIFTLLIRDAAVLSRPARILELFIERIALR